MHLVRLIYFSENRLDPIAGTMLHALQALLADSKRNNAACGLTGVLAFDGQWFLQALEGDRDAVWDAFMKIMRDTRHAQVRLVESVPVDDRMFGAWSMRLVTPTAHTQLVLDPYMTDGVLQPHTMSGADMLQVLVGITRRPQKSAAAELPLAG